MGSVASFTPCTDIEPYLDGKERAVLSVYPTEVTFGNTVLDQDSADYTILLVNDGSGTVAIDNLVVVGDFLNKSDVITEILAGERLALKVAFHPQRAGEITGGIYIDAAEATGTKFVKLIGTGTLAPASSPQFHQLLGSNGQAFDSVNVVSGTYALIAEGTFDGAVVQLQWRADDETAWADVAGASVSSEGNSVYGIPLTACQVRVTVTGGTAGTSLTAKLIW